MTDLEALEEVLNFGVHCAHKDGVKFALTATALAQVAAVIDRVKKAKPRNTAYKVLEQQGVGIYLEDDVEGFRSWLGGIQLPECTTDKMIASTMALIGQVELSWTEQGWADSLINGYRLRILEQLRAESKKTQEG